MNVPQNWQFTQKIIVNKEKVCKVCPVRHIRIYEKWRLQLHAFTTSALDEGGLTSLRTPLKHGGEGKNSEPCQESSPGRFASNRSLYWQPASSYREAISNLARDSATWLLFNYTNPLNEANDVGDCITSRTVSGGYIATVICRDL
jgi:hypothetical protein